MRIFLSLVFLSVSFGCALTLEEVRSDLRKNVLASDSIELGIRTTVSSPSISAPQVIGVHLVRKGPGKVFAEIKMPMSRQRMIVNGNRMKTIDLDTRKSRVVPYGGNALLQPEEKTHRKNGNVRCGKVRRDRIRLRRREQSPKNDRPSLCSRRGNDHGHGNPEIGTFQGFSRQVVRILKLVTGCRLSVISYQ